MRARIFVPPKSAMQSGWAKTKRWALRFEQQSVKQRDPLMGWTSNDDTLTQVTLTFTTRDEAIAYAERHGIAYDLELPAEYARKMKSYADNFKFSRRTNWTH
jgi:hypothetical protein